MSVVDEIKERLDIVDVVSGYVPLRKAGRNYKGLCPFHTEKTPSFIVFPEGQNWHCFGACGSGGDVFTFIMKIENMEFAEALRFLARRAGVELRPRTEAQVAEDKQKERLREINEAAARYFHNLLLNSSEGQIARSYLTKREINQETINRFQLGYALDDWQALSDHLRGRGYKRDDILAAGLIVEREDKSGHYDRFRGRLMIPIRDIRGYAIGFGARALDDSQPKYLNSPQTPLFDKGSVLYGLDLAKEAIRDEGLAVIAEGYMDVLTAHQNGFKNVVASMGTALTEAQLRLLKRLTKSFVLALDADVAGSEATLRGLEVAKEALDRRLVPVPTWRGLIRYEHRLDADIRIAVLPQGKDPDEIIRENAEEWAKLVREALPVVDYYFSMVTTGLDLDSPKDKSAAVRQLLPVIQESGDKVEQTHYLQKLARLVRIDERVLLREMGRRASRVSEGEKGPPSPLPSSASKLEEYCLILLLREPDLLWPLDDLMASIASDPLRDEDFSRVEDREIFASLRRWANGEHEFDLDAFRSALDTNLHERFDLLAQLLAETTFPPEDELEDDVAKCVLRLRERRLRNQSEKLRFLQEDAKERGDLESMTEFGQMVGACIGEIRRVQQELSARTILGRREQASVMGRLQL